MFQEPSFGNGLLKGGEGLISYIPSKAVSDLKVTYHSLLIAAFERVQVDWFPARACSISQIARLRRPFAARRSVAVVDAGVKAVAADASKDARRA